MVEHLPETRPLPADLSQQLTRLVIQPTQSAPANNAPDRALWNDNACNYPGYDMGAMNIAVDNGLVLGWRDEQNKLIVPRLQFRGLGRASLYPALEQLWSIRSRSTLGRQFDAQGWQPAVFWGAMVIPPEQLTGYRNGHDPSVPVIAYMQRDPLVTVSELPQEIPELLSNWTDLCNRIAALALAQPPEA